MKSDLTGDIQMSLSRRFRTLVIILWNHTQYALPPCWLSLPLWTSLFFRERGCTSVVVKQENADRRFLVATSTSWYMVLLWKVSCTISCVNRAYKRERKIAQNFTSFQNAQLSAGTCISISTLSICCSFPCCARMDIGIFELVIDMHHFGDTSDLFVLHHSIINLILRIQTYIGHHGLICSHSNKNGSHVGATVRAVAIGPLCSTGNPWFLLRRKNAPKFELMMT